MAEDPDALRELYLDVAGEETITERREEEPSRDPIEGATADIEREVSSHLRQDGLADAVEGAEAAEPSA